jgi:hypothetical protein
MRSLALTLMLFAAMIISGCRPGVKHAGPWVKKIDSGEMSSIVINFSVKMKREKHLELEDSWIAYDDYIKKICLQYSSQRLLTVYDARLVMVELVEDFLYRLNNNEIVSFELDHFPFTANDLDVKINFESYYGRFIDELYVGLAWLKGGCVHFYAFDRKDDGIDWSHDRFEPYTKSRELALIKREADMPYVDRLDMESGTTPHSPLMFDRYSTPYN